MRPAAAQAFDVVILCLTGLLPPCPFLAIGASGATVNTHKEQPRIGVSSLTLLLECYRGVRGPGGCPCPTTDATTIVKPTTSELCHVIRDPRRSR
jgi:hypothetical protein